MRLSSLVVLLSLTLTFSCAKGEVASPRPVGDVPVFLISIDTLRSDRLPVYGYAKGSAPAIDAFRKDAILFEHAFSQYPLTLPSHASIFTGQPPYVHGVRNNLGYTLEASHPSLATMLKQQGYSTGGAVSSFVLRDETGIAAGFDFYDDFMTHSPLESATSWQRDGELSRQALSSWLSGRSGNNVFGFLHLYEPHSPYTPPAPHASSGDPYDGEISYADAIVGRFLDELKQKGLYDNALIILLSDHGEGLGEHGEKEHGIFVYRESIQVPLLVKLPGNVRAGESVSRPVSLTDVVPTVMDVAGVDREEMGGVSLLSDASPSDRWIYSESYYPRLQYGWSELVSMIGPELHYIQAPRVEMYRYLQDPKELSNVAEESRRDVVRLRQELQKVNQAHPFEEPRVADPEDVKKLAALGYLGSTSSATGPLPDPKDKIEVLKAFGTANDLLRRGRYSEVVDVMKPLLAENPDFISGWGVLGGAYRKLGQHELALETLKTQMTHSNGSPQVALSIAELLMEMKRFDEAREHALLAKDGGGLFVHETLAQIALGQNDLVAAEQAANESLALEPDRVQALMLLSQVRRLQKRPAEELELLDKARDVVLRRHLPPIRDLELRRGETLLQTRRVREAEEAFRAETVAFPSNLQAWANLALVVGAQGRRPEARAILDEAIKRNPGREAGELAVQALLAMEDEAGARELRARLGR